MKNKIKYLQFNNIRPLIQDYCYTYKTPSYIEERIYIFLTYLYYSQLSKKFLSTNDKKKYTPITQEFLIAYLSKENWKIILEVLSTKEIIIVNRDEKTIYSHITEDNKEVNYHTYRFKINFELFKGYTEKSNITYKNNNKILDHLYQMKYKGLCGDMLKIINMECKMNVNITEEQFYNESIEYYSNYYDKKVAKVETPKEFDEWYNDDMLSKYNLITYWNSITLKDRKLQSFVKIDKFGNRKHTLFTLIPSFCRKYIDGLGDNIKELDLKQSQPTILNCTFNDRGLYNKFDEILNNGGDNDIYNYYEPNDDIPRSVKKSKLFSGIFSAHGSPDFLEFESIFKEEAKLMRSIQTELTLCYTGTTKKIPQHKNVSCLLQRKETEIFKDIWVKLINKRIKFISVHDSILCSEEDYKMIKRTMTFSLNRSLGLNKWEFNDKK